MIDNKLIPRIVHQTWMGSDPVPELQAVCMAKCFSFCEANGYEHLFWQKKANNEIILKSMTSGYGPIGLSSLTLDTRVTDMLTDEKLHPVMKADIMRFVILYEIGGFYADLDIEIINIQEKFRQMEYVCGLELPRLVVCTAFIGSKPKNPANKAMIDFILSTYEKIVAGGQYPRNIWDVLNFTGPDAYTKILSNFSEVVPFNPEVFFPLPPYRIQESVTMHYFNGSKKGGWVFDKCDKRECGTCEQKANCNIIKEKA